MVEIDDLHGGNNAMGIVSMARRQDILQAR